MASKREQMRSSRKIKQRGRNYFQRELASWTQTVIGDWQPGSTNVSNDARSQLRVVLRRGYDQIAKQVLGVDWQVYKQDEEDPYDQAMRAIAGILVISFADRVTAASDAVLGTLVTMMGRANTAAQESDAATVQSRNRVARIDLTRRMRNHRLIIAVTESHWTVNTTRNTAVLAVADPLGNSVQRIADLIESGDINGARRLARESLRLARLPTSVKQGQLLNYLSDARDRLVTPLAQGRIVATLRSRAATLGVAEKEWSALFHNTRESHAAADGQVRPIDEPFTVGGYPMQYPMDGSLGAPLSEIVNCQCETVYL